MRRVAAAPIVAAGGFFVVLAIAITWPLVTVLDTHVPGRGADDNVNFLWNLWWMREALASNAADVFHSPALFHPFGVDLVFHSYSPLNAFIGATAFGRLSIVEAQNLLLILTMALNGFCACLLGRRVTGSIAAGLAGGVYFAAAPYFAGHLLGHFNLVTGWCLPLFALALLHALDRPRATTVAAAGLAFAVTAYADYYYAVYAAAFVVVLTGWRWLDGGVRIDRRRRLQSIDFILITLMAAAIGLAIWIAGTGGGTLNLLGREVSMRSGLNVRLLAWLLAIALAWRRWRPHVRLGWSSTATIGRDAVVLTAAVAIASIATAPIWIEAARLAIAGDYTSPARLWRSATEGIDLVGLVAGNPFHPIWRSTGEAIYAAFGMSTIESVAWMGIAATAILVARRRDLWRQPQARLWIAVAIVFFVWACGPYLRVGGVNTGIWLPETALHFVPVVSNARIPGRAMVMVYLAVGVLLALALAAPRAGRALRAPAVWAIVFVLADFISAPTPVVRLETPAIYQDLARLPAGAVWEWPFGISDGFGERGQLDNATLYYQMTHRKPLVGGFVARLSKRLQTAHDRPPLSTVLALSEGRVLSADELRRTRDDVVAFGLEHDIRYVVVDMRAAPDQLRTLAASLPAAGRDERDGRQLIVLR